jgi:NodT family efflux transporter outer membrane factor (OMF) lipoprotein
MHFLGSRLPLFIVTLLMTLLSSVLTGCMVGPDFHPPHAPQLNAYTESPLPAKTARTPAAGKGGKAQTFVSSQNIPMEWWHLFRSPVLNKLIVTGLANSPNLTAAYAALRLAQENLNVQIGNSLFPAFNAQGTAQRQLFSGASIGIGSASSLFNLFNTNVNVSYTLDAFGGARRQIESLGAQVDYQQFQLIAAYLTLTANIVTTAVTIASLKAQIEATHALIRAEEGQLSIIQKQFRYGGVSRANVFTQQTLVSQTRATLPPLEKNLSQNRHALSVLVGAYPNGPLPQLNLYALNLPTRLPVTLPSNLVRQRPDVRASEAQLHAACAKIGVATANFFPQIILNGSYGWEATIPSTLFSPATNTWLIATQITQSIFQGGAQLAQRRAAVAMYDQAFAQYRQTVLQAFQNVADSLRALETDARTLREYKTAEIAARGGLALATIQYRLGGASYLSLLIAQQQYHQSLIARIQAQAARYNDTAALFQALGGGWWNRPWCVKECLYEK